MAQSPTPMTFSSDGCSLFPNRDASADWCHCCVRHDAAYWPGGTEAARLQADLALRDCVARTGAGAALAEAMYGGVRAGGHPQWPTSFRWGYAWGSSRPYRPLSADEARLTHLSEAQIEAEIQRVCRPAPASSP